MDNREINAIARRQHGLASRAQLMALGVSRSTIHTLVATGRWDRARAGVYVVGPVPSTWHQRVMAACLAGGDDVRASHRTSIRVNDLVDRSGRLELLTDGYRRVRLPDAMVHRTIHLLPEDCAVVDGIPVTSTIRALIDVGGRQSERTLGAWIDRALMRGQLDLQALARRTNELALPGRERPTALMRAIAKRGDGHDPGRSAFEARVIDAMAHRGIPQLVRQHPVKRPDGRDAFIDLADPASLTAVELDGWATHGVRSAFEADRIRGNELLLLGWHLLRFTWGMSDDYICATIAAAIERRP